MKSIITTVFLLSQLLLLSACKEETILLKNIDQYKTNRIISTLHSHGIEGSKTPNPKNNNYSITIDKADLADATIILSAKGPFTPTPALSNPCEFKGLIATPSEEKQCKKYRLEMELGRTLQQIDGVLSAEVHIVMSEKGQRDFDNIFSSSSAAIFIKHQANINLNPFKTNMKRLVEKSVPGLTYDKVSLVLIPATIAQLGYNRPSKKQDDSNIIIGLLVALLIISWMAFLFRDYLQRLKIVKVANNIFTAKALRNKKTTVRENP